MHLGATLEEAAKADVLMFVQDGAHADRLMQEQAVIRVLHEIGAHEVPRVIVMNKVDMRPEVKPGRDDAGRVWFSKHWSRARGPEFGNRRSNR